jgi:hypothetical protein
MASKLEEKLIKRNIDVEIMREILSYSTEEEILEFVHD